MLKNKKIPTDIIYIFHKHGARNHHIALNYLVNEHHIELKYREFSIGKKLTKSLKKGDFNLFKKQLVNLSFLLNLFLSKNKKIVLGIAPFDSKLITLLKYLKHHQVFYHTSWTYWDKSFHPITKYNSLKVFKAWRYFLEEKAEHIFTVTHKSKTELLKNYNINKTNISVVFHALDHKFLKNFKTKKIPYSFIYYGRLDSQKGIEELLYFFENNSENTLTIIGNGKKTHIASASAKNHSNIVYKQNISNKEELALILSRHQYLVVNSKKDHRWEELFGLVIIESMAQGLIPISSNHSGPKEIISKDIGHIFKEGKLLEILPTIIANDFNEEMSRNNIIEAQNYTPKSIANKWSAILD